MSHASEIARIFPSEKPNMLKSWGKTIGYGHVFLTAMEATRRIPKRKEPTSKYADAVWDNILPHDLKGKTFAITGTSRGMGFILAAHIAQRGGNLFLLNRWSAHAEQTHSEIQELASAAGAGTVVQINCDLCNFNSVREAAREMREIVDSSNGNISGLDCLVLNAGMMAHRDLRTKDGYDVQIQVNHLSHFLLTSLVFDLLERAAVAHGEARVVSHSSGARHSPDVALREDVLETKWAKNSPCAGDTDSMAKWLRYQQSKRLNLAFTYALADFIQLNKAGTNIKAVCAHPGATNSGGLQSRACARCWTDRFINGLAVVAGASMEDGCLGLALATLGEGVVNGDLFGPKLLKGNAILLPCEREFGIGYSVSQLTMLWDKSVSATGARWFKPAGCLSTPRSSGNEAHPGNVKSEI